VEDWNWEIIFYGHYKSLYNHCDIIGSKIYGFRREKKQNKGYYGAVSAVSLVTIVKYTQNND